MQLFIFAVTFMKVKIGTMQFYFQNIEDK